jgi:acyl carrier protein
MQAAEIKAIVKSYVLSEFLPGESPDSLGDSTELITNRILDSLGTLKLVSFLEEKFGIVIEPHEADVEYLNTLESITALVLSKQG